MINKIIIESQKSRKFSLIIVEKSSDMHKYITEQIIPILESQNVKYDHIKSAFVIEIDNNDKFKSEIMVVNAEHFDINRIIGRYYDFILILDTCNFSEIDLRDISFRKNNNDSVFEIINT